MVRKSGLRTGVTPTKVAVSTQRENQLISMLPIGDLDEFEVPCSYDSLKPYISGVMEEDEYHALGVIGQLATEGRLGDLKTYISELDRGSELFLLNLRFIDAYLEMIGGNNHNFQALYDEVNTVHMSVRLNERIQTAMNGMEDLIEDFDQIDFTYFPVLFNEIFLFRLKGLILPASANILRMVQTMHIAETYVQKKQIRKKYLPRFLNDLSVAYSLIGAIDTAIEYGMKVIQILGKRENIPGEEFHQIIITCTNLAMFYVWIGRPKEIESLIPLLDMPSIEVGHEDRAFGKGVLQVKQLAIEKDHREILEIYDTLLEHLSKRDSKVLPGLKYFMAYQMTLESFFHQDMHRLEKILQVLRETIEHEEDETLILRGEIIILLAEKFLQNNQAKGIREQIYGFNESLLDLITLPQFEVLEFTTYQTILISLYINSLISSHHENSSEILIKAVNLFLVLEKRVDDYRMTQAVELHYSLNRLLSLIFFLLHQENKARDHLVRAQQLANGQFPFEILELDPRILVKEDEKEYSSMVRQSLEIMLEDDKIRDIYEEFVLRRGGTKTMNLRVINESPLGITSKKPLEKLDLNPPIDLLRDEKGSLELDRSQMYGFWSAFTEWEADVLKKLRFLLWTNRVKDVERLIIMLLATEVREIVRFQLLVMKILNDLMIWKLKNEPKDNSEEFWQALEIWNRMSEHEKYLFLASRNLVLFRRSFGYESNEEIFETQENEKLISWMGEELHFDLVSLLIIRYYFDKKRGITNRDIVGLLSTLEEEELNPIDYYNILIMKLENEEDEKKKDVILDQINEASEKYGLPFIDSEENIEPFFF